MSDLFHEAVSEEFIRSVFNVMNRAHWHHFQILTKRAERLEELAPGLQWGRNIWQGVSVENADYLWRLQHLRSVPASVRFLSIEPLLGPLRKLPLKGIDWVIVGGESGPRHRAVMAEWVADIRDQCQRQRVPFFFKQWGGRTSKSGGNTLEGRQWMDYPIMKRRIPKRSQA